MTKKIIKVRPSTSLMGNLTDDINATGENDVLTTRSMKQYLIDNNTFSLEEKRIGYWIDKKPLYMKSFNTNITDSSNSWKNIGTANNIETLVDVKGSLKQSSDGNIIDFPRCTIVDNKSQDLYINGTSGTVNVRTNSTNGYLSLTILYTKTTDEPDPQAQTSVEALKTFQELKDQMEADLEIIKTYSKGVIDSGSNDNGTYIKYSDGTMICYGSTSGSSTNADYWGQFERTDDKLSVNFPQNFISTPIVCATSNYEGSTVSVMTSTITISSFKFIILKTNGATQTNYGLKYIAIGRWKDYDTSLVDDNPQQTIINTSVGNYSSSEQVIGLWTDKKPLYRKTFNFGSLPDSSSKNIPSGLSGVSVKNIYGACHRSTDTFQPPINSVRPNEGGTDIGAYYDANNSLRMITSTNRSNMNAEITIEYTKDSDSPVTSKAADIITVVNGKDISDLETLIQQRISDTLAKNFESVIDSRIDLKMNSKILWSNSKPTSAFSQQNIKLDSKDYNYLTWYYYNWVGGPDSDGGMRIESVKIPKGYNVNMTVSIRIASGLEHLGTRGATYVSDTEYTVRNQGGYAFNGSQNTDNAWVVPIMVVGSNY